MQYQQYVDNLDEQTINKLAVAVETGRWESGDKLTQKQKDSAMQAVMLWQAKNEVSRNNEPFKVNNKAEFSIGKGKVMTETPLEYRERDKQDLIFKSKG